MKAGAPNGKSVGIVGSGPAGLSCATYLARLGYAVTIYEQKSLPGGLDTYGMAEYKMTQAVSVEEAKMVVRLGVEFRLNTEIGRDDFVCGIAGANTTRFFSASVWARRIHLNVAGEDLRGVYDALDFIEQDQNARLAKRSARQNGRGHRRGKHGD